MTITESRSQSPAAPSVRRYDVDWLRTLALGLLIVYHAAISFQPFGPLILFITNQDSIEEIWPVMTMVNVWRIPVLFMISGMGVYFAMQRRNWRSLLADRTLRILLPFVFGVFTLCPLFLAIGYRWFFGEFRYTPHPGHLWFLANIFAYVLVFLPIFVLLKSASAKSLLERGRRLLGFPGALLLFALPIALEAWLVGPATFASYANTLHGFLLGGVCFFLGFYLVSHGEAFWKSAEKTRWAALGLAFVLYLLRLLTWNAEGFNLVTGLESACWMFAIFGFACRHLNRPSQLLTYLSGAVYTVYIVHLPVQFALSYYLIPTGLPAFVKLILLMSGTFLGSFVLYEVLKRLKWIRPLFGMKLQDRKPSTAPPPELISPDAPICSPIPSKET